MKWGSRGITTRATTADASQNPPRVQCVRQTIRSYLQLIAKVHIVWRREGRIAGC